jgi:hypothetical protein
LNFASRLRDGNAFDVVPAFERNEQSFVHTLSPTLIAVQATAAISKDVRRLSTCLDYSGLYSKHNRGGSGQRPSSSVEPNQNHSLEPEHISHLAMCPSQDARNKEIIFRLETRTLLCEFYVRWQHDSFAPSILGNTPQPKEAFGSLHACMEHRRFVDPVPIGLQRSLEAEQQSYKLQGHYSAAILTKHQHSTGEHQVYLLCQHITQQGQIVLTWSKQQSAHF